MNLTILQKIEIIKELDKGSSAKYLANFFGIGIRTVYDIKTNREKILEFYANTDSNKGIVSRKRMREAQSADLDAVLFEWFRQRRSENIPITGPILCQKAKELHKELGIDVPCEFSSGWLTKFKNRHGIRYLKTSGDKLSADNVAAEEFVEEFEKIVHEEKLSPEQIYNMDETGLFWCNLPRKTFVSEQETEPSGVKDDKRRITVLVCSNAAGTHKCKALVVGKSANPRALSGVRQVLPVIYKSNKKAWITRELCTEWFQEHFLKEVRKHYSEVGLPVDSKILLLMDNCTAHPELVAPNVSTLFLPPNTTSLIQPMDQGVINSMKCNYKSAFLRRLLNSESGPSTITDFKKKFTIKDCIYMLREAWDSVTQETLANAWHKLWPESIFLATDDDDEEFGGFKQSFAKVKAAELMQYAQTQLANLHEESILEFLTTNDEPQIVNHMTDNEIITSVLRPEDQNSDTESDGENEDKISVSDGISLGEKYLKFLEMQDSITEQEVLTVYRIQQKLMAKRSKVLKQTKIDTLFKKNC